jgi:hypothetical protein
LKAPADVLNGEAILKRFEPFKGKMMNTIVPLLPKNFHDIPSRKHLGEAFDRVCLAVCKKQQKASLAKRRRKEKVATPPANEDEAMKEIDELTAASVPDGWMCQKGCPEKLLLSVKIFCKSKAFQSSSAKDAKPAHSRKEIRIENTKQKLQDFADGRTDVHKEEAAKKQKASRQKANSGAVEANSIHRMSVSMAKNTNSDMLTDNITVFLQGKEFFSDELQKEMAENLGQSLLAQTKIDTSRAAEEIAGPAELLESDSKSEVEAVAPAPAAATGSEVAAPAAAGTEENNSDSD